jgi:hypothetical protein
MFVSSDCAEILEFRESAYSATRHGDGIRLAVKIVLFLLSFSCAPRDSDGTQNPDPARHH